MDATDNLDAAHARDAGRAEEEQLLAAARAGDAEAFRRLMAPQEARLRAHCYRMLGSLFDAEDALQDTMIKAWQGLGGFDGRSQIGTWLYRIATTTCLNALRSRSRRALPIDVGFRSGDPGDAAGAPSAESTWLEPLPDAMLGPRAAPDPQESYELRESVELALVAAWQHLPARQRAALLLTDVLGYPARDAAEALDTTTAALNSALQRARALVADRVPARSQQATLRRLGDAGIDAAVARFQRAMDDADVTAVVGMLREDATWSMPPQPAWFAGHDAIGAFLAANPFRYFRWRSIATRANGQPALAAYSALSTEPPNTPYLPHAINVLTFADAGDDADTDKGGGPVTAVTTFLDVTRRGVSGPDFRAFTDTGLFARFGLPAALPA
ncbi:putative sigma factor includes region 2 [Frankia canadensis]|uniref:Putative sigma factor includes region 2 n=1 Tax=Frankia canadensis TaxID=1836972 RepID=A0A2I2KKZ6_9ACTN|nr:RNA polymerase subunit sigma-70 [Frankia canadensis]SNQ46352.1 putative sigma factor includes region 2 [Frankia canadensis]SOU53642.1 putative sigma factor includes region 2 [Frankia canadensis]